VKLLRNSKVVELEGGDLPCAGADGRLH
jgi:hypothetical protein